MTSKHYDKHRGKRQRFIVNHINGDGNVIDNFIINKGHKDGVEIHSITDTGLIIIHNKNTGKLVTKLIARPEQIKRYYKYSDKHPPRWLLSLAEWHQSLGYNK
ncbi:MAG: hypothetical protein IKW51_08455 [Bacteroidales bacterium]|nr:hypothetical protein [Bacteroidales bacterium]